jgi:hypothetical protein
MPQLIDYRRGLGYALDDLGAYVMASGSTTTAVSNGLKNSATNASTDRYNSYWVYVSTGAQAGQQWKVKTGGYAPSTGTLTMTTTGGAPGAGDTIEITHLFPSNSTGTSALGEDVSYRTIINRALSRLLVLDSLTLPLTTSQTYSLAAYPWLDREERLIEVREPGPTGGLDIPAGWRRPFLRLDGPTSYLDLTTPFDAGAVGSLTLVVERPADTLVNGADSTVGLSLDTDTAIPSVNDVVTVGLMEAYRALMARGSVAPAGQWAGKFAAQLGECRKLRRWDRSQDVPEAPPVPAPAGAAA